jgi:hypothetical protein
MSRPTPWRCSENLPERALQASAFAANRAVVRTMAQDPPDHDDDDAPLTDPRSRLLIALWHEMDRAEELSTGADVISRLPQIAAHLEAALALIRRWQEENP